MRHIEIYPDSIKEHNSEAIDLIEIAINRAIKEQEESPDLVWGSIQLYTGKAEFVPDVFFDHNLEEYRKAMEEFRQ